VPEVPLGVGCLFSQPACTMLRSRITHPPSPALPRARRAQGREACVSTPALPPREGGTRSCTRPVRGREPCVSAPALPPREGDICTYPEMFRKAGRLVGPPSHPGRGTSIPAPASCAREGDFHSRPGAVGKGGTFALLPLRLARVKACEVAAHAGTRLSTRSRRLRCRAGAPRQ
jgi:hypothetical protein